MYKHRITSLITEVEMNSKRSRNVLLESVLQELCAVESVTDDAVVDSGQCRSHRISVLFIVNCVQIRS